MRQPRGSGDSGRRTGHGCPGARAVRGSRQASFPNTRAGHAALTRAVSRAGGSFAWKRVKRDTVPVQPETRYARSGDVNVAYQVLGEGSVDIVYVDVISHLEIMWEVPSIAAFLNRLGSFGRLIMLNQRGVG